MVLMNNQNGDRFDTITCYSRINRIGTHHHWLKMAFDHKRLINAIPEKLVD